MDRKHLRIDGETEEIAEWEKSWGVESLWAVAVAPSWSDAAGHSWLSSEERRTRRKERKQERRTSCSSHELILHQPPERAQLSPKAFWEKAEKMYVCPAATVIPAETMLHTNSIIDHFVRFTPLCFNFLSKRRKHQCMLPLHLSSSRLNLKTMVTKRGKSPMKSAPREVHINTNHNTHQNMQNKL